MTISIHVSRNLLPIPGSYEEMTIDGGIVAFSVAANVHACRMKFLGGPIRFTFDGALPSTVFGMFGYDGDEHWFSCAEAQRLKLTRSDGVNGLVQKTCYLHP